MRKWRIEDSEELYNITGWGTSYFGINEKGHVVVTPRKDGVSVDLKELMNELQLRDMSAPVLVRFPDILDNRIEKTARCFQIASEEYGYKAQNFIIYPIKVNQMRPVVEEIISHGKKFNLGLEAGSKPELHAAIAMNTDSDSLIICNGYKDESYIELALLAQKMGKRIFLVVEKMNELQLIARLVHIGEGQQMRPQIHAHIFALDADLHAGTAHHIRSHGGRLRTRSAAACSGTLTRVSPESSSASSSSTLRASTSPI